MSEVEGSVALVLGPISMDLAVQSLKIFIPTVWTQKHIVHACIRPVVIVLQSVATS